MLISNIKSNFTGFLKPNLYKVYFIAPFMDFDESISYLCKDAVFPFLTINTKQLMVDNKKQNIAQDFDYDPANFTFHVDQDNRLFEFINKWISVIRNENGQLGYRDNYAVQVGIEVYNNRGDIKMEAFLLNAVLVNIEDIPLGYDQNDTLMTMSVSLAFDEVTYFVNNIDTNAMYDIHQKERQEPYQGFYLGNIGFPLDALRSKVGGIIGQENLYKIENKLGFDPASKIDAGNVLSRKAQKNFSLANKAF